MARLTREKSTSSSQTRDLLDSHRCLLLIRMVAEDGYFPFSMSTWVSSGLLNVDMRKEPSLVCFAEKAVEISRLETISIPLSHTGKSVDYSMD